MQNSEPSIIPKPKILSLLEGKTNLGLIKSISLKNNSESEIISAKLFQKFFSKINTLELRSISDSSNNIFIEINNNLKINNEGYFLTIKENNFIKVQASSASGLFYAFQSFKQICNPTLEKNLSTELLIQNCKIMDEPRFAYRGMHLDVSRHFFDVNFIKTYIDMIALHKMNVFHWHLTDDNGWRIEIDSYPELTKTAAWRVDRRNEPWKEWSPIKENEKATYGGFYTKREIKEIVKYASEKHIKIIPEIEMPGHTSEGFSAYPALSCKGNYIPVNPGSYWPNTDIFCAGNNDVFTFLETILEEVIELFPGNYIHIGGDEADKTNWKKCIKCQKRINDENLKNEEELQSWFIKKIEKFILSKNKDLIGWDEILEGGLAKSATVMSWRGIKGGVEAANQGHDVIMCPVTHCYFDYYQTDPESAPKAFGGLITLKKVYSFDPIPKSISKEKSHLILGGQGNLWTEYVQNNNIAQYRVLPRMSALSEVLWSGPGTDTYENFYVRLKKLKDRFKILGWKYSEGFFEVSINSTRNHLKNNMLISISSEKPDKPIYYTIDNTEPTINSKKYIKPFIINKTTIIKAAVFNNNKPAGKIMKQTFSFHKAIGKTIHYNSLFSSRYPGSGDATLINGINGSKNYNDGKWQGWKKNNAEIIIDLHKKENINNLSISFLESHNVWIFLPKKISISFSNDLKTFFDEKEIIIKQNNKNSPPNRQLFKTENLNLNYRYIKLIIKNQKFCPDWHNGSGGDCWLFIDEVQVN